MTADDEAVGCPVALLTFARLGIKVTNLVTNLGHSEDHDRRRREVTMAAQIGGFDLLIDEAAVSADSDTYESIVTEAVLSAANLAPERLLLVSPSPHDNHPRHEKVGRAVARAAAQLERRAVWLMYAVWGSLPLPTTFLPFGESELLAARSLLSAYAGEIARNDFDRLVYGRSIACTTLGMEQIFGFGAAQVWRQPYTELYSEVQCIDSRWLAAAPRQMTAENVVAAKFDRDITDWIESTSARSLVNW